MDGEAENDIEKLKEAIIAVIDGQSKLADALDDAKEKGAAQAKRLFFVGKYIRLTDEDDDKRNELIENGGDDHALLTLDFE